MHPLFLLLPAALCAVFTFASAIEVAEDWHGNLPADRLTGSAMIAASFAGTIICIVPTMIWIAGALAR
jgi:hypothetical protein